MGAGAVEAAPDVVDRRRAQKQGTGHLVVDRIFYVHDLYELRGSDRAVRVRWCHSVRAHAVKVQSRCSADQRQGKLLKSLVLGDRGGGSRGRARRPGKRGVALAGGGPGGGGGGP